MNPRTSCLLLLSLSPAISTSGQIDPQTASKNVLAVWSENLYVRSLSEFVEARDSKGATPDSITVLQNDVLRDWFPVFPSRIGSVTIEYLTDKAVRERYRRLHQKFAILEIKPMNNSRNELVVNCSVYSVGMRRRKLVLGVSGGYMVHWRYDCQSKEFVRAKVEPWYPRID